MKFGKKLSVIGLSVLMSTTVIAPAAFAGWGQSNGKYYYVDDSTNKKITSKWIHTSSGYYYIGKDSYMVTGWAKINGNWHYFRENGLMATGWRQINNKWFYLKSDGVMQTGWLKLTENNQTKWYYLKEDGSMATSWREINDKWYYFQPGDGTLIMDTWAKINGNWYRFGSDGTMQTGWYQQDGSYYYINTKGVMQTGWKTDTAGNRYYMDTANGKMSTGWKKIDNTWYYFSANGKMQSGWLNDNGTYYYLDNGKMIAGKTVTINGVQYSFASNGACQNVSNVGAATTQSLGQSGNDTVSSSPAGEGNAELAIKPFNGTSGSDNAGPTSTQAETPSSNAVNAGSVAPGASASSSSGNATVNYNYSSMPTLQEGVTNGPK
jgi:glucan-binding YG repeat protein